MKKFFYSLLFFGSIVLPSAESFSQDIGVSNIIIPTPGSTITKNVQFNAGFTLKNFGSTTIAAGTVLGLKFQFNSATPFGSSGTLNNSMAPGDSVNLGIALTCGSQPAGPVTLCIWTELAGEIMPSNDTSCVNLILVDPTGIDGEDFSVLSNVYYYDNAINVSLSGVTDMNSMSIDVYSYTGQLVKSVNVDNNGAKESIKIEATELASGIYIVGVYSKGMLISRKKIMVN